MSSTRSAFRPRPYPVNICYNNPGCNGNLDKAIRCHGINYFLQELTITSIYRFSLRFQEFSKDFLGNRYIESSVSRRTKHFYEELYKNGDSDRGRVMPGRGLKGLISQLSGGPFSKFFFSLAPAEVFLVKPELQTLLLTAATWR